VVSRLNANKVVMLLCTAVQRQQHSTAGSNTRTTKSCSLWMLRGVLQFQLMYHNIRLFMLLPESTMYTWNCSRWRWHVFECPDKGSIQ